MATRSFREHRASSVLLLLTLIGVGGCSSAPGIRDSARSNTAGFERALYARDLSAAGRFARFLESDLQGKEELFAQYFLMTCQPRKAYQAIQAIPDDTRRELFTAVLYSLVSVERPPGENRGKPSELLKPLSSNPRIRLGKRPKAVPKISFPVKSGEIWADEWKELKVSTSCKQMPVMKNPELRARYRVQARELFARARPSELLADIDVVALAMDVDVGLPPYQEVLKAFSARSQELGEHPYYARLKALADEDLRRGERNEVHAKRMGDSEFALSDLNLRRVSISPHAVQVPLLIQKKSDGGVP